MQKISTMTTSEDVNYQGFPNEYVAADEKKSKKYIKDYAQAIFDFKKKNKTFYDNETERIMTNRKHAEGLQSIDKYKTQFAIKDGDHSYLSLDWTPIPVVKKYVNLRVGEMINADYSILCRATDVTSQTEKDKERNKLLTNMKLKDFSDMIKQEIGVSIIPEGDYVPVDKEELDIHLDMNFKLNVEIATEKLLDFTLAYNDWKRESKHIIKDFLVIKKAAIKLYFDENNRVRLSYVDWANMFVPFCVKEDFSDAKYAGEVKKLAICDIRRADINGDLREEDLYNIAKSAAGLYGNQSWDNRSTSFHNYFSKYEALFSYDDFLIPVLDFEFLSMNTEKWEEKQSRKGGFYFNKKSQDYEPKDETRRLIQKDIEYKYKGHWIVGTNHLYDYGLSEDICREKKNGKVSPHARLSFIMLAPDIIDMQNKSMVEDIIPHESAIQLASLKIQQLIAKLPPSGLFIDISVLNDVVLGEGKSWTPLQIRDLYSQTGDLYYNGTDVNGMPINRKPIEQNNPSFGSALQELIAIINFNMQMIRDVSGINETRDSSAPDKNSGLGLQKMAQQGSRNATRSLDYDFIELFERTSERAGQMIQYNISKGRNIEEYENVIGTLDVDALKTLKELPLRDIGVFVEAKIDTEEKMLLEQNIAASIAARELSIEDAIMIRQIKNIKQANKYLIYRKKKKLENEQAMKNQDIMNNAKVQQQSSQVASQGEMAVEQAKTQSKLAILKEEERINAERDARLHSYKMEELGKQGDVNFHLQSLQGAMKTPTQPTPQPAVAVA